MICDDILVELTARAHDAGDPGLDEAVDAHLEACSRCAGWDDEMAPIRGAYRGVRELDVPAFGFDRLIERLDEEGLRSRRGARLRTHVLVICGAAAATLLLAFSLGLFSSGDDPISDIPSNPFAGAAVAYGDVDRNDASLANVGDGPARVDLADGVGLVLAPLTLLRTLPDGRVSLERGRLYVRTSRPLSLACGDAEVAVLGTAFSVARDGTEVEVRVAEGRVELRTAAGRVLLDPGTSGRARGADAPTGPKPASAWDALVWLGETRLDLRALPSSSTRLPFELELGTDATERRPIRGFSPTAPDFVLTITDPRGRVAQVTIQAAMILAEENLESGLYWLDRDHPYSLRFVLNPEDLGSEAGTYTMVASYSIPETEGTDVMHGRFESAPIMVTR